MTRLSDPLVPQETKGEEIVFPSFAEMNYNNFLNGFLQNRYELIFLFANINQMEIRSITKIDIFKLLTFDFAQEIKTLRIEHFDKDHEYAGWIIGIELFNWKDESLLNVKKALEVVHYSRIQFTDI